MPTDPDSLFFIVGTGRCGSTLLQAMLSSHPRIYVPPELRYFGRHDPAVAFTDPLRDADVDVYLETFSRDIWWQDMGLDLAAFEAAIRGGVRRSREIYLWILGHVTDQRAMRKPRLGDKTPYYIFFGDRIANLFPEAQFIHLYRDPRDVAASYLEQYWTSEGTALRCAGYTKYVFEVAERLADTVGPDRFCAVKYESLVEDAERELTRLCAFLGEDYDDAMLRFGDRRDPGFLEVEEPWKGLTREGLTSSRIGRYANRLTPRQIWTVERMLGSVLREIGYEPNGSASAPLRWRAGFWAERVYRKAIRSVGLQRPLLDEQAVLARRNELAGKKTSLGE